MPRKRHTVNKSITYHLLHQGRARYTLIRPAGPDAATGPEVKHVVMGSDSSRGEVRQLVVEGGWWKASEIPEEDLAADVEKDQIGCLISEASPSTRDDLRFTHSPTRTDHTWHHRSLFPVRKRPQIQDRRSPFAPAY